MGVEEFRGWDFFFRIREMSIGFRFFFRVREFSFVGF